MSFDSNGLRRDPPLSSSYADITFGRQTPTPTNKDSLHTTNHDARRQEGQQVPHRLNFTPLSSKWRSSSPLPAKDQKESLTLFQHTLQEPIPTSDERLQPHLFFVTQVEEAQSQTTQTTKKAPPPPTTLCTSQSLSRSPSPFSYADISRRNVRSQTTFQHPPNLLQAPLNEPTPDLNFRDSDSGDTQPAHQPTVSLPTSPAPCPRLSRLDGMKSSIPGLLFTPVQHLQQESQQKRGDHKKRKKSARRTPPVPVVMGDTFDVPQFKPLIEMPSVSAPPKRARGKRASPSPKPATRPVKSSRQTINQKNNAATDTRIPPLDASVPTTADGTRTACLCKTTEDSKDKFGGPAQQTDLTDTYAQGNSFEVQMCDETTDRNVLEPAGARSAEDEIRLLLTAESQQKNNQNNVARRERNHDDQMSRVELKAAALASSAGENSDDVSATERNDVCMENVAVREPVVTRASAWLTGQEQKATTIEEAEDRLGDWEMIDWLNADTATQLATLSKSIPQVENLNGHFRPASPSADSVIQNPSASDVAPTQHGTNTNTRVGQSCGHTNYDNDEGIVNYFANDLSRCASLCIVAQGEEIANSRSGEPSAGTVSSSRGELSANNLLIEQTVAQTEPDSICTAASRDVGQRPELDPVHRSESEQPDRGVGVSIHHLFREIQSLIHDEFNYARAETNYVNYQNRQRLIAPATWSVPDPEPPASEPSSLAQELALFPSLPDTLTHTDAERVCHKMHTRRAPSTKPPPNPPAQPGQTWKGDTTNGHDCGAMEPPQIIAAQSVAKSEQTLPATQELSVLKTSIDDLINALTTLQPGQLDHTASETKRIEDLIRAQLAKAESVKDSLLKLPRDSEVQLLLNHLHELLHRLTTLQTFTEELSNNLATSPHIKELEDSLSAGLVLSTDAQSPPPMDGAVSHSASQSVTFHTPTDNTCTMTTIEVSGATVPTREFTTEQRDASGGKIVTRVRQSGFVSQTKQVSTTHSFSSDLPPTLVSPDGHSHWPDTQSPPPTVSSPSPTNEVERNEQADGRAGEGGQDIILAEALPASAPGEEDFEGGMKVTVKQVRQVVTRRVIRKRRRIIRRVVMVDGVEQVTEEVIEEPDEVDERTSEMSTGPMVDIVHGSLSRPVSPGVVISELTHHEDQSSQGELEPATTPDKDKPIVEQEEAEIAEVPNADVPTEQFEPSLEVDTQQPGRESAKDREELNREFVFPKGTASTNIEPAVDSRHLHEVSTEDRRSETKEGTRKDSLWQSVSRNEPSPPFPQEQLTKLVSIVNERETEDSRPDAEAQEQDHLTGDRLKSTMTTRGSTKAEIESSDIPAVTDEPETSLNISSRNLQPGDMIQSENQLHFVVAQQDTQNRIQIPETTEKATEALTQESFSVRSQLTDVRPPTSESTDAISGEGDTGKKERNKQKATPNVEIAESETEEAEVSPRSHQKPHMLTVPATDSSGRMAVGSEKQTMEERRDVSEEPSLSLNTQSPLSSVHKSTRRKRERNVKGAVGATHQAGSLEVEAAPQAQTENRLTQPPTFSTVHAETVQSRTDSETSRLISVEMIQPAASVAEAESSLVERIQPTLQPTTAASLETPSLTQAGGDLEEVGDQQIPRESTPAKEETTAHTRINKTYDSRSDRQASGIVPLPEGPVPSFSGHLKVEDGMSQQQAEEAEPKILPQGAQPETAEETERSGTQPTLHTTPSQSTSARRLSSEAALLEDNNGLAAEQHAQNPALKAQKKARRGKFKFSKEETEEAGKELRRGSQLIAGKDSNAESSFLALTKETQAATTAQAPEPAARKGRKKRKGVSTLHQSEEENKQVPTMPQTVSLEPPSVTTQSAEPEVWADVETKQERAVDTGRLNELLLRLQTHEAKNETRVRGDNKQSDGTADPAERALSLGVHEGGEQAFRGEGAIFEIPLQDFDKEMVDLREKISQIEAAMESLSRQEEKDPAKVLSFMETITEVLESVTTLTEETERNINVLQQHFHSTTSEEIREQNRKLCSLDKMSTQLKEIERVCPEFPNSCIRSTIIQACDSNRESIAKAAETLRKLQENPVVKSERTRGTKKRNEAEATKQHENWTWEEATSAPVAESEELQRALEEETSTEIGIGKRKAEESDIASPAPETTLKEEATTHTICADTYRTSSATRDLDADNGVTQEVYEQGEVSQQLSQLCVPADRQLPAEMHPQITHADPAVRRSETEEKNSSPLTHEYVTPSSEVHGESTKFGEERTVKTEYVVRESTSQFGANNTPEVRMPPGSPEMEDAKSLLQTKRAKKKKAQGKDQELAGVEAGKELLSAGAVTGEGSEAKDLRRGELPGVGPTTKHPSDVPEPVTGLASSITSLQPVSPECPEHGTETEECLAQPAISEVQKETKSPPGGQAGTQDVIAEMDEPDHNVPRRKKKARKPLTTALFTQPLQIAAEPEPTTDMIERPTTEACTVESSADSIGQTETESPPGPREAFTTLQSAWDRDCREDTLAPVPQAEAGLPEKGQAGKGSLESISINSVADLSEEPMTSEAKARMAASNVPSSRTMGMVTSCEKVAEVEDILETKEDHPKTSEEDGRRIGDSSQRRSKKGKRKVRQGVSSKLEQGESVDVPHQRWPEGAEETEPFLGPDTPTVKPPEEPRNAQENEHRREPRPKEPPQPQAGGEEVQLHVACELKQPQETRHISQPSTEESTRERVNVQQAARNDDWSQEPQNLHQSETRKCDRILSRLEFNGMRRGPGIGWLAENLVDQRVAEEKLRKLDLEVADLEAAQGSGSDLRVRLLELFEEMIDVLETLTVAAFPTEESEHRIESQLVKPAERAEENERLQRKLEALHGLLSRAHGVLVLTGGDDAVQQHLIRATETASAQITDLLTTLSQSHLQAESVTQEDRSATTDTEAAPTSATLKAQLTVTQPEETLKRRRKEKGKFQAAHASAETSPLVGAEPFGGRFDTVRIIQAVEPPAPAEVREPVFKFKAEPTTEPELVQESEPVNAVGAEALPEQAAQEGEVEESTTGEFAVSRLKVLLEELERKKISRRKGARKSLLALCSPPMYEQIGNVHSRLHLLEELSRGAHGETRSEILVIEEVTELLNIISTIVQHHLPAGACTNRRDPTFTRTTTQEHASEPEKRLDQLDGVTQQIGDLIATSTAIRDDTRALLQDAVDWAKQEISGAAVELRKVKENAEEVDRQLQDIQTHSNQLQETASRLGALDTEGISTAQQLDRLSDLENQHHRLKTTFRELLHAVDGDAKFRAPAKELEALSDRVEATLASETQRLMMDAALRAEYEQTLTEFTHIIEVAKGLLAAKPVVNDWEHFKAECNRRRRFFGNLKRCQQTLEKLEHTLDGATKAANHTFHHTLHQNATDILQQATHARQKMAVASARWQRLEHGLDEEFAWLRALLPKIPPTEGFPSTDAERLCAAFQSLYTDVIVHQTRLWQLSTVCSNLQDTVQCAQLQERCDHLQDSFFLASTRVTNGLHAFVSFKEARHNFEGLMMRLGPWLQTAETRMDTITLAQTQGRELDPAQFWELKAQLLSQEPLRREASRLLELVLSTLSVSDETALREQHENFEERWHALLTAVSQNELTLEQETGGKGEPVDETLDMVQAALAEAHETLDNLNVLIESEDDLYAFLEKMQVLKASVLGQRHQLRSLLSRTELQPDEAERVSRLMRQTSELNESINDELEAGHTIRDKMATFSRICAKARRAQDTLQARVDHWTSFFELSQDILTQALTNCQNLDEEISDCKGEVRKIEGVLATVPATLHVTFSPLLYEAQLHEMEATLHTLTARIQDLKERVQDQLGFWRDFEHASTTFTIALTNHQTALDALRDQPPTTPETLVLAQRYLQGLRESVAENRNCVDTLQLAAKNIHSANAKLRDADSTTHDQIQQTVSTAVDEWTQIETQLTTLAHKYATAQDIFAKIVARKSDIGEWISQKAGDPQVKSAEELAELLARGAEHEDTMNELQALVNELCAALCTQKPNTSQLKPLRHELETLSGKLRNLKSILEDAKAHNEAERETREQAAAVLSSLVSGEQTGDEATRLDSLRTDLLRLGVLQATIQAQQGSPAQDQEAVLVRPAQIAFQEKFAEYLRAWDLLGDRKDLREVYALWHDHLKHIDSFLHLPVAESREGLLEDDSLCALYQSVLIHNSPGSLAKRASSDDEDVTTREALDRLQRSIETVLSDRQAKVQERLNVWDAYRHAKDSFTGWLRIIEKDKRSLELPFLQLQRVHATREQVENMLARCRRGHALLEDCAMAQMELLRTLDSGQMQTLLAQDLSAAGARLHNLEAALRTWLTHLGALVDKNDQFNAKHSVVEKGLARLSDAFQTLQSPSTFNETKLHILSLKDIQQQLLSLQPATEELHDLAEELKLNTSLGDARNLLQSHFALTQRMIDLQAAINRNIGAAQEKVDMVPRFDTRCRGWLVWADGVTERVERPTQQNLEDYHAWLANTQQLEIHPSEKIYEWLLAKGTHMADMTAGPERQEVAKALEQLELKWAHLTQTIQARKAKTSHLLQVEEKLSTRVTQMLKRLREFNSELQTASTLPVLSPNNIDQAVRVLEAKQQRLNNESGTVNQLFNLSEIAANDCEDLAMHDDARAIRHNLQSLHDTWNGIISSHQQKHATFLQVRDDWRRLMATADYLQSLLAQADSHLTAIEERSEEATVSELTDKVSEVQILSASLTALKPQVDDLRKGFGYLINRVHCENDFVLRPKVTATVAEFNTLLRRCDALLRKNQVLSVAQFGRAYVEPAREFLHHISSQVEALSVASLESETESDPEVTAELLKHLREECEGTGFKLEEAMREAGESACARDSSLQSPIAEQLDSYNTLKRKLEALFTRILSENQQSDVFARKRLQKESPSDTDSASKGRYSVEESTGARGTRELRGSVQLDVLTRQAIYDQELENAVTDVQQCLQALNSLSTEPEPLMDTSKYEGLVKTLAEAQASVDMAQHLGRLAQGDQPDIDTRTSTEVEGVRKGSRRKSILEIEEMAEQVRQYKDVVRSCGEKLREASPSKKAVLCPVCSPQQRGVWDSTLWRLQQWLQHSEGSLKQAMRRRPPVDFEELEVAVLRHRELLLDLDSHRSLVLSLQSVLQHLNSHGEEEVKDATDLSQLRERLQDSINWWRRICHNAALWQARLQLALIENSDFHLTVQQLEETLDRMQQSIQQLEPVHLDQEQSAIARKFKKFEELSAQLTKLEPDLRTLQQTAEQLFVNPSAIESEGAVRHHTNESPPPTSLASESDFTTPEYTLVLTRIANLHQQLRASRRVCDAYARHLAALLQQSIEEGAGETFDHFETSSRAQTPTSTFAPDTNADEDDEEEEAGGESSLVVGGRMALRALRASLPLQAVMAVLLGLGALLPYSEQDYSCFSANTFARSFETMLHYPNGPPPI